MKLYYQKEKHKLYLLAKAKREIEKRIARNKFLKNKRKWKLGKKDIGVIARETNIRYRDYKKIVAPTDLSLIRNTEEVIDFIMQLKDFFNKKRKVFLNLKKIKNIDYDSIVVLLATLIRFKSNKIAFDGSLPRDRNIRKILNDSGFINIIRSNEDIKDEEAYEIFLKRKIHTHASKIVDSQLSSKIIGVASETVWGTEKRCQGVQRAMIELMLNTNNHATIGVEGDKHWWLSVNHDYENRKVSFSFVDFGVGIFTSLNKKPDGHKFHGILNSLKNRFKTENNFDLLKLILEGELHRTSTNKHFRGKGLPGIFEARTRNHFNNLVIISNDAYADVDNNIYKQLNTNFGGTFVHWELCTSNVNFSDGTNKDKNIAEFRTHSGAALY